MNDQKIETLGEKAYNEITSSLIDNTSNNNTINDLLTVEIPQEPVEMNNNGVQPVEAVSTKLVPFVDVDDANENVNEANEEYTPVENYNNIDDEDIIDYGEPYGQYYSSYASPYYNGYIEENTMSLKKRLIISVIITVVLLVVLYFIYYYCYLKNKKSIQKRYIILIVIACLSIPVATWIIWG